MYSRPPTEKEKAELESIVVGYVVDSMGGHATEEAVSKEAIRNLIDHAAIAVFDDYTYEDEQEFEGKRRQYKKLLIVVFPDDPFEPKICMWEQDGTREGRIVGFDVVGEHVPSKAEIEADFEAELEYRRSLNNPDNDDEDSKQLITSDQDEYEPFLPDFPE